MKNGVAEKRRKTTRLSGMVELKKQGKKSYFLWEKKKLPVIWVVRITNQ